MVKARPPSPNSEFIEIQCVVEAVARSGMAG